MQIINDDSVLGVLTHVVAGCHCNEWEANLEDAERFVGPRKSLRSGLDGRKAMGLHAPRGELQICLPRHEPVGEVGPEGIAGRDAEGLEGLERFDGAPRPNTRVAQWTLRQVVWQLRIQTQSPVLDRVDHPRRQNGRQSSDQGDGQQCADGPEWSHWWRVPAGRFAAPARLVQPRSHPNILWPSLIPPTMGGARQLSHPEASPRDLPLLQP